ncbi:lipase family protein [Sporomusa malonica]|uniref:lipase family protein n=1 Tax=Sporomusa malonica TaxID=112901 RepID=UPI001593DFD5|nr:lipase family protein [Sporomusa malonica]
MKLLVVALFLLILLVPGLGSAEARDDYSEAYKLYIAAGVSAATYNDRIGEMASRYLEQDGWKIDRYVQNQGKAGARFILAQKDLGDGRQTFFLAFVGTETKEDVKFDLKVDKAYFAGKSIKELEENAAKQNVPTTEPKVHRGFLQYVKSMLEAKAANAEGKYLPLRDILVGNKDAKLYLVGHSLGGAAAIITGAGLVNTGVSPEQIEVITFGSPAAGNAAFAASYDNVLKVTRVVISGDVVTGVLQSLVGGYKQFGRKITLELPELSDQPHRISEYVDLVMKNYYTQRQHEARSDKVNKADSKGAEIYIAPLKNNLSPRLDADFWYMREAWRDEYKRKFSGCTLGNDGDDWRQKAKEYRWVIVPEVSSIIVKKERNKYYITLNQTIYENGVIVEMADFSTGNYNLTPLEAFIHGLRDVNEDRIIKREIKRGRGSVLYKINTFLLF